MQGILWLAEELLDSKGLMLCGVRCEMWKCDHPNLCTCAVSLIVYVRSGSYTIRMNKSVLNVAG